MAKIKPFKFSYNDSKGYKKSADSAFSTLNNYRKNNYSGVQKAYNNVQELYNVVMNAPEFNYDLNNDQLFQMFKQQYNNQGQQAMANAMGMTSNGYNSSIAQTNAQSIWGNVQDALSDKAIETYQAAYDRYNNERQQDVAKYNVARDIYAAKNDNYTQGLSEAQSAYDIAQARYTNSYNNQYNKARDTYDFDLRKKLYNG